MEKKGVSYQVEDQESVYTLNQKEQDKVNQVVAQENGVKVDSFEMWKTKHGDKFLRDIYDRFVTDGWSWSGR